MSSFDVIVLGVGGVGSAACLHLATRGARVLGLEQHGRAHSLGSSHGETRLTRASYLARPAYVPLLRESERGWAAIERDAGRQLLARVGHVVVAPHGSATLPDDVEAAAARLGVRVEALGPADVAARFPGLRVPSGYGAYVEPGAGYLAVEACVEACCALAAWRGAELRFDEGAIAWAADGEGVSVTTARTTYRAGCLVICGGAWSADLLRALGLPLVVRRIPQTWFAGAEAHEARRGMPCFLFELAEGTFYGAPAVSGRGVKVCGTGRPRDVVADPSRLDRTLRPEDLDEAQRFLARCLPGVSPEPVAASVCMCVMTPDERFVVDAHPAHPRVLFAAGLSGHGFKLVPALAEALAELYASGRAPEAVRFLGLGGRCAHPCAEAAWTR